MKMHLSRIGSITVAAVLLIILFPAPAKAYLDPGTGSYIFQILLAALLGALFSLKMFWKKIKLYFSTKFTKKNPGDEIK